MIISIIAAIAANNVIGHKNRMPWHLPNDLRHFREITLNKPIIMGRKTYESIGRILPNRRNIIITRNKNFSCPDADVFHSLADALLTLQNSHEVIIIGGAEIYKQALPIANKMYLTFIHHDFDGDCYFPVWNKEEWQEIERQDFNANNQNPYSYSFITFARK